jgi:iron complex transport system substrate-binding protein
VSGSRHAVECRRAPRPNPAVNPPPRRLRIRPLPLLACCVVVAGVAGSAAREAQSAAPQRIVSLVPAVTEMLFAIGAGARLVGVSSFDEHPPEVRAITRVGGLVDPDVERILSLRPDLAIVYGTQDDLVTQLARARIPMFTYRHAGLPDVTATIRALGVRVARAAAAAEVAGRIEQRLAEIRARVTGRGRPGTLLVFGRQAGTLRGIYASGGLGFLHDMLEAAGGRNLFEDVPRESVQATTEVILARAPEVIVELKYGGSIKVEEVAGEREAWSGLAAVPAVKNGRVIVLVGDEFVVPGPRVAEATERLSRALHPEAWR